MLNHPIFEGGELKLLGCGETEYCVFGIKRSEETGARQFTKFPVMERSAFIPPGVREEKSRREIVDMVALHDGGKKGFRAY